VLEKILEDPALNLCQVNNYGETTAMDMVAMVVSCGPSQFENAVQKSVLSAEGKIYFQYVEVLCRWGILNQQQG
jgi:hypothetical protein